MRPAERHRMLGSYRRRAMADRESFQKNAQATSLSGAHVWHVAPSALFISMALWLLMGTATLLWLQLL